MARFKTSFEQRAQWLRDRQGNGVPDSLPPVFSERHYSVGEIGALWSLSQDAVRRLFQAEIGVLVLGDDQGSTSKRRYTTLRIPESVVLRVYHRMTKI
jgi:hypothetical protein